MFPPPVNWPTYPPPNQQPPGSGAGLPPTPPSPPGYNQNWPTPPMGGYSAPPTGSNPPMPPNGWPPNLPWQGQPPGQSGGYGGYPPAVTQPPASGGGGGGGGQSGEYWNGYRIIEYGPGDNILVDYGGQPKAFNRNGQELPHLYAGYDMSGNQNAPGDAAPVPGAPAGPLAQPPSGPATFYAPTTPSPYLQFGGNWLSYLSPEQRAAINTALTGAGFSGTGTMNTWGMTDYLKPDTFSNDDYNTLALDPILRDWLKFFGGQYGYGISYQLPAGYQNGLPPAPPLYTGGTGS